MLKLGSHDSMTYLPARHWWLAPFKFMAKCLSKSIKEQYEDYGIRLFDIRIKIKKNLNPVFAHGLMEFKGDVDEIFSYLDSVKEPVDVRLILENGHSSDEDVYVWQFEHYCRLWSMKYKNIRFFCGIWKPVWLVVYKFDYEGPTYEDKYASNNDPKDITGCILDDLWPWIYARFNNHKNIQKGTDKDYLLIDFVNIL